MKNILKLLCSALISVFLSCSCEKQVDKPTTLFDKDGIIIKQPYLWKTTLTDAPYIGTFVEISLIWNDKMIFGAETNNSSELALLNIETGEKIWQKPYAPKENAAMSGSYQYNNIAIIDAEKTYFAGINIETGEIFWTFNPAGWFWPRNITGINNTFFLCGQTQTINKPYELTSAWYGNVETGVAHEFYVPDITAIADTSSYVGKYGKAGGVENIIPYEKDGIIYLLIYYSTRFKDYGEHFICLYNSTTKEFVYKDKKLPSGNRDFPFIANNKLYLTLTDGVYCCDLFTGAKLWSNMISIPYGRVYADNKLYGIIHGVNNYLVGIDLINGNQLWKNPSEQCIAPMRYLDGVVYFVSSADGRLHAVDASNGKYLWKIDAPDNSSFKPECTVVAGKNGGKGKVIVSSYLSGFCYEAVK